MADCGLRTGDANCELQFQKNSRDPTLPRRRRDTEAYRDYVEEAIRDGLEESPWEQVQGQLILGGASLKRKVQSLLGGERREQSGVKELRRREFSEAIEVVARLRGRTWAEFRDRHGDGDRDLALWLARERCGLRLKEARQGVRALGVRQHFVTAMGQLS
jgi:hypothetical protein